MFVAVMNTPRPYAWGSRTAIAEALGYEASGEPEAELWLGTHGGSPARLVEQTDEGTRTLDEWITANPQVLGSSAQAGHLPFLLKILAADGPLSLQAHPSKARAEEGFERENREGIPVDAGHRNYKDPNHKPEMVYALSETFEVLCGFRSVEESERLFASLGDDETQRALAPLRERLAQGLDVVVTWLLTNTDTAVTTAVVSAAERGSDVWRREYATVCDLARAYPGDPGIVLSLLLNRVSLRRGEALYLPAGNIHAYLKGLAVEIMASSDNVLRGGLTPKHIDVEELVDVLDFRPLPVPYVLPDTPSAGVEVYRPDVPDFALARIDLDGSRSSARFELTAPAIIVNLEGALELRGRSGNVTLSRGGCFFVTPDEGELLFEGEGVAFLATENDAP